MMKNLIAKLSGGEHPEQVLVKRIKIFVLIGIVFIAISKLLYLRGVTLPNLELIIPTLVVIGCFSSPRHLRRYFVVVALAGIFLIDLAFWGFLPIYAFTWPGFVMCWLLATRNKLSMFDRFTKLLYRTTLTAAVAILLFDIWTCFGSWLGWYPKTLTGLAMAYLAQIPFTLYHLSSLIFIPPMVGLAKALVKIPIAVPLAVNVKARAGSVEDVRR